MVRGARHELLEFLAGAVESIEVGHPVRVAVDGAPASGKTTLADQLGILLRARGREVVRASIDDFLEPRERRYRRGEYSAEGCYRDAHDHAALNRVLLDPLGPDGDRRHRRAVRDPATDAATSLPLEVAAVDAVLLLDGVFLLRQELVDRWDLRIFVTTPPHTAVRRAVRREREVSSPEEVTRRWHERYLPAQQLYVAEVNPEDVADVVVHHDDLQHPSWEDHRGDSPRQRRVHLGSPHWGGVPLQW